MASRDHIHFYLNGKSIEVKGRDVFRTTARFLREQLQMTGTKIVCEEGDCGACTCVFQSPFDKNFKSVDSCIMPVYALDGGHLVTVEGLKTEKSLHPAQTAMIENYGSQCGYCTPGMVCALAALAEHAQIHKKEITERKAKNFLTGNLCRCTGYDPIIKAAVAMELANFPTLKKRYPQRDSKLTSVVVETEEYRLHVPATLAEALKIKAKNPGARVIAGATDLGVLQTKGKFEPLDVISLQNIGELHKTWKSAKGMWVGARVTLSDLEKVNEEKEFGELLHVFASPQIKNNGTLVGNVVNASPIADTIPYLLAADGEVHIRSAKGKREVPLSEFYLGYKKIDLKPSEIVTGVFIPKSKKDSKFVLYKVSTREDLDISTSTFAARVDLKGGKIEDVRIVLGGVGPTVMRMKNFEKEWIGQKYSSKLVDGIGKKLRAEIKPLSDVRGSDKYRMQVCENFFKKFDRELS
jgi:xanthine dehydrogenase small subunit